MFFKRGARKRKEFYHQIELVYNNSTLLISEELRQALLDSVLRLEKGDRIAYLAYKLYPLVCDEILHCKSNRNDELVVLQKYLEKARWKYYWGSVLSMAFIRQQLKKGYTILVSDNINYYGGIHVMLIKYTFLVLIFIATQLLMFVIRLKDDEKKNSQTLLYHFTNFLYSN